MGNQERIALEGASGLGDFRIAHVLDDDKFTDMAILLFESVYPGKSQYFIVSSKESPMVYVTATLAQKVKLDTATEVEAFSRQLTAQFPTVFLHALSHKRQQLALALPSKIVKVWFIWGFDLYQKWPFFRRRIFESETARATKMLHQRPAWDDLLRFNHITFWLYRQSTRTWSPRPFRYLMDRLFLTPFYKAARSMDVVVPVIPNEFDLIRSMHIKARYAPFTYGNLEDLMGEKMGQDVLMARDILVGNSADPANNHIDIFKKLMQFDLGNRKVFVPLSYAGDENYKALVIEKGKAYLGAHFVPLTQFMKLDEYNKIVAGCGILIFNHIRQQGVGNIILMGAMGAKVFLNEKSTVYRYYQSLGIKLWPVSDLNQQQLDRNLTQDEWQQNRKIYFEQYAKEAVKDRTRQLLAIVAQEIQKKA